MSKALKIGQIVYITNSDVLETELKTITSIDGPEKVTEYIVIGNAPIWGNSDKREEYTVKTIYQTREAAEKALLENILSSCYCTRAMERIEAGEAFKKLLGRDESLAKRREAMRKTTAGIINPTDARNA